MRSTHRVLPLHPLLFAFRHTSTDQPDARIEALRSARSRWLQVERLDRIPSLEFAELLREFYRHVDPTGWHAGLVERSAGVIRFGIAHLLRGADPIHEKFERCANPGGSYFVLGVGPGFWASVVKAMDPDRLPDWSPAVAAGLARVGMAGSNPLAAAVAGYGELLARHPDLTATDLDRFFRRVGGMRGRDLPHADPPGPLDAVPGWVRRVRAAAPLRTRLAASPARGEAPTGGLEAIDDAAVPGLSAEDRQTLLAGVTAGMRDRFRVHPLEVPDVLSVASRCRRAGPAEPEEPFAGFAADTFRFLADLAANNSSAWMAGQRERYRFVVRDPMVELCRALADRYAAPVLRGEYGWNIETDPRPGRAMTSVCKNDFGRSAPYQPVLWVTFYRKDAGGRRHDAQFFVRLEASGLACGFHLGRTARDAGRRFRAAVQAHGDLLFRALSATGAGEACGFRSGGAAVPLRSAADLRAWATAKDLSAERRFPADAPVLRAGELVNEVLLTFDRLVPLFAAAADADPTPVLARRAGDPAAGPRYDRAAFARDTGLSDAWLSRTLDLLRLKKQLVLQGVPGTGKTHVARCLARVLAGGRADAVRLVQFHPGYSYEEFVEGVRPQPAAGGGVAYPVADGVLPAFAARAAAHPSDPHVLLIDEVNRGNLPRVFGELLFLLEYRDQAVTLPYSKREFRLPPNLFLLATMNPTDRSTAALDAALRRRFSFVDMPPDAAVLARWLDAHPPADGDDTLAVRVVRLFETLNRKLARDLGPDRQVGHSYFMVPALTPSKLRAVWDHHVAPLLAEAFAGQPGRMSGYDLDRLLGDRVAVPRGSA